MKVRVFLINDSGAVTVDWTVLAAAIVGLGVATGAAVRTGVMSLGGDIDSSLVGASVAPLGTLGDGVVTAPVYAFMWFSQGAFNSRLAQYNTAFATEAQLLNAITQTNALFTTAQAANQFNSGYMVNADEYFVLYTLAQQRGTAWPSGVRTPSEVNQLLTTAGLTPACVQYGCATLP